MDSWLGIALLAYLIGASIEGVSAANQLARSMPDLTQNADDQSSHPGDAPKDQWQVLAAIATVSICGAFFWPCRLIHRSLKME